MRKRQLLIILLTTLSFVAAHAQERNDKIIQLGYGWTSVVLESGLSTNGSVINLSFEKFNSEKVSFGGSVHYLSASQVSALNSSVKYIGWSVPIFFDAKYYLRSGKKLNPFFKGSIGYHFSGRKVEFSGGSSSEGSSGVTLGAGAGLLYSVSDKIILNLDYQWIWINSFLYQDAGISTVSLNLGYKLGN